MWSVDKELQMEHLKYFSTGWSFKIKWSYVEAVLQSNAAAQTEHANLWSRQQGGHHSGPETEVKRQSLKQILAEALHRSL